MTETRTKLRNRNQNSLCFDNDKPSKITGRLASRESVIMTASASLFIFIFFAIILVAYTANADPSCQQRFLAGESSYVIKMLSRGDPISVLSSVSSQNNSTPQIEPPSSSYYCIQEPINDDPRTIDGWTSKYIDEQAPGFRQIIKEDSIDERLANIMYAVAGFRMVNIDSLKFNLGDGKLNQEYERLATGSRFNDELCGQEMSQMLALIDEMGQILREKRQNSNNSSKNIDEQHFRLARVLDSFGRYEAGVLVGRTHMLGSYSQCTGSQMILDENVPEVKTTTRYCIAKLRNDRYLDPSLKAKQRRSYDMDNMLNVGICIPESCHTLSFRKHKHLFERLLDSQFKLPKSIFIEENLELDSVFCLIDDDSYLAKIPFSGKLLIIVLAGWLSLAVYSTYVNNNSNTNTNNLKDQRFKGVALWINHLQNSLDLKRSWEDFIEVKQVPPGRINLNTMNAVKVIGCFYVVFGHALLLQFVHNDNILFASVETDPFIFFLIGGTVVVDTFYVISGIIVTYLTMKRLNSSGKKNNTLNGISKLIQFLKQSFQIVGMRYVRLLPLYFLVFWFTKSIFNHLGSGPMWDSGFNKETEVGYCRQESWLTPFTGMAAYLPLSAQCLPHTWSIASDIFFSFVLAPIIVLLVKRPKLAATISVLLCIASNAAMLAEVNRLPDSLMAGIKDLKLHTFSTVFHEFTFLYTTPHYRLFSILIGTLAGYTLYHYNQPNNQKEWPNWLKGPATKASLFFVALLLSVAPVLIIFKPFFNTYYPLHHYGFTHTMTTGRLFWALSNAVLLIRMTTDWKDNFWMRNCGGKFWQYMSKLNYSILLVHMDVLSYDAMVQTELLPFAKYRILTVGAHSYMLSCVFAVILHVCVENPIDKLTKGFIYGVNNKERPIECKNIGEKGETTVDKLPISLQR